MDRTVDIVFAVVTIAVFAGLTIVTIVSAASSGVAGLGIWFVVWLVAVAIWSKLTREWLVERRRVETSEAEKRLLDEIEKLREAIEKLRESLER